jgi:excisionase family DNA binding protein
VRRRRPAPPLTAKGVREHADLVEQLLREQYLTTEEVALVAKVSPSHVRRAISAGRLRTVPMVGTRLRRITPGQLREWLAEEPAAPAVALRRIS